jgi:hypothetical protein
MRYLNLFMAVLFLFGAAVQINDPDPIGWMAIYLAAVAACVVASRRPEHVVLPFIVGAIAAVWATLILSGLGARVPVLELFAEWEMRDQAVEETRESYGLLIIAGWMVVLGLRALGIRRHRAAAAGPTTTTVGA